MRARLMAYWQLTHATDSDSRGGSWRDIPPGRLRTLLARPASLGDLMHHWLMTHATGKQDKRAGSMLRKDMIRKGALTESAAGFWGIGDG